jgi:hypothetical protein
MALEPRQFGKTRKVWRVWDTEAQKWVRYNPSGMKGRSSIRVFETEAAAWAFVAGQSRKAAKPIKATGEVSDAEWFAACKHQVGYVPMNWPKFRP